jgi:hypothetical protein
VNLKIEAIANILAILSPVHLLQSRNSVAKFNQKLSMSRPCKPAKLSAKWGENHSDEVSMQSGASNFEMNEAESEGKVADDEIESKLSFEMVVNEETSSLIKNESLISVEGDGGRPMIPEIVGASMNSPFTTNEEVVGKQSKENPKSKAKNSLNFGKYGEETVDGRFFDVSSKFIASLASTSQTSTTHDEVINVESSAARREVDDLDYIKSSVGPAIIKALAAVVIHQPADPIDYFANFLLNYRCNQRMFGKRDQD